ncbi:hypothetical protein ACE5IS_19300 [Leptospira wolffii]|uniref:Porin n=1 Tax=Leptospira wolffii TaxID=409998 RepID=A0ABV5BU20_9LEPT
MENFRFYFALISILLPGSLWSQPFRGPLDEEVMKEIREYYDPKDKANKVDRDLGVPQKRIRFFSIQPGATYDLMSDLDFGGRGKHADMGNAHPKANFFLDIRSQDIKINEAFGFQFLFHSASTVFDRQSYSVPNPKANSSDSSSSSGSSSSSSGTRENSKNSVTSDLGTRMNVDYNYIIPTFYWGNPDVDGFRAGFGVGLANIRMSGNVDFRDPADSYAKLLLPYTNRPVFLESLTNYQLASGLVDLHSGDPVFNYLLLNLSQANNLELMGLYLASKGTPFSTDLLSLIVYSQFKNEYTPLEMVALAALSRTNVNMRAKQVFAYMVYLETPTFGFVKFRFSLHGPIFKDSGYTVSMTTLELAAMVPIDF